MPYSVPCQYLLPEERLACSWVQFIGSEACLPISILRSMVCRKDLQRDFAAAALECNALDFRNDFIHDTHPTVVAMHITIMNVDQRLALES